jgi:hypothetical protein
LIFMKRAVLLTVMGIALAASALAEQAGAAAQPYTWDVLASIGGATAATLLIVQYLKVPLDKWRHIPTRLLVLVIAAVIMGVAQWVTSGVSWEDVLLILVNAFVVALSAMGAYELSFAKVDRAA